METDCFISDILAGGFCSNEYSYKRTEFIGRLTEPFSTRFFLNRSHAWSLFQIFSLVLTTRTVMNTFRQQNHMQDKEYESQGVNTALDATP